MVVFRSRVAAAVIVFAVFLLFGLIGSAAAQGIQQTPYSAANEVRRLGPFSGLGSAPSNPLGLPGSAYGPPVGSDTIPLSSGMLGCYLPRIPNLEFGFLYNFGKNLRSGRFTADYVLPVNLSSDSVLFGEAHAEGWDFWKKPTVSVVAAPGFTVTTSGTSNRVDLSLGGGYRKMLGDGLLLGANAFYDSSRLFNKWYSSGGLGMEMAATVGGDDAVDVNFNWYGNLFSRNGFINAFRNRGGIFDLEAGYSHALLDHTLDLRLKVAGYQFDVGQRVSGWRGGADLTTRDGMFTVRYEHGQDPINGSYDTVGGFVNIGFQLENVLKGESPFTMPEPVFKSPRNLTRMLTQKVKRNWHQPTAVVLASSAPSASSGCNTDRFIPSIPATSSDPNFPPKLWGNAFFDEVDAACLEPQGQIVVDFHYTAAKGGAQQMRIIVDVLSATLVQNRGITDVVLMSDTISLPLTLWGNQNVFVGPPPSNPVQIQVMGVALDGVALTSFTASMVKIRFNQ
jgi:hypothetical protein